MKYIILTTNGGLKIVEDHIQTLVLRHLSGKYRSAIISFESFDLNVYRTTFNANRYKNCYFPEFFGDIIITGYRGKGGVGFRAINNVEQMAIILEKEKAKIFRSDWLQYLGKKRKLP